MAHGVGVSGGRCGRDLHWKDVGGDCSRVAMGWCLTEGSLVVSWLHCRGIVADRRLILDASHFPGLRKERGQVGALCGVMDGRRGGKQGTRERVGRGAEKMYVV